MKQCFRFQLLLLFSLMLIPLAGFSQSSATRGSTPAPYPTLKSTGNAEADRVNHMKAVEAWKEKENKRVQALRSSNPGATNTTAQPGKERKERLAAKEKGTDVSKKSSKSNERSFTIIDLPGYPKYVTTGNSSVDEKNYQIAKSKWMDEHSDLYKKYVEEHSGNSGKLKRISSNSSK